MTTFILYRKIRRTFEDFGIWITLKRAISYLSKLFYENRIYRIYGINLQYFQPKQFDNKDFTLKILDSKNLNIVRQIEDMDEWLKGKLVSKLENGSLCLVALDKTKIAGYNLISFGEVHIPLLGIKKILGHDEAWSEQITANRGYRQKGLATELRYRVFEELKKRGIRRLYGGTLTDNKVNLRLARKVGFQGLVDLHYFKFFHLRSWRQKEIKNEDC